MVCRLDTRSEVRSRAHFAVEIHAHGWYKGSRLAFRGALHPAWWIGSCFSRHLQFVVYQRKYEERGRYYANRGYKKDDEAKVSTLVTSFTRRLYSLCNVLFTHRSWSVSR